jgi:hypothetical protein
MMTRVQLTAAAVRAQLVALGTPVAPLATTDALLRRQLAVWLPMLRVRPPTRVRSGKVLVIPLKEQD